MSNVCAGTELALVGRQQKSGLAPLVVDLDGTLVKTDLLLESVFALVRRQPFTLLLLPVWLAHGKAWFKRQVARRVSLDTAAVPWRSELIEYLKGQHKEGRKLVLATGSDTEIARRVASQLDLFDLVIASDGMTNLCGESKRKLLVSRFGERGFDYAGDGGGWNDLAVWRSARTAILVNPEHRVRKAAARVTEIDRVFADRKAGVMRYVRALRPEHWLKNLLVFVPLFAAQAFLQPASIWKAFLAFLAYGCIASGGYLFNDLIDLDADRHHPQKKFRAFAAGDLPLSYALGMAPVLVLSGCVLGALVSPLLTAILLGYLAMSMGYSLHVKHVAILDVLFLAGLYSMRIMAGSAALGVWSSYWLLAFSTFLFFSLALVKRYGELVIMRRIEGDRAKARGYELSDGELLAAMGTASGYLAVLVFALYITTEKAELLYPRRELFWILCPLLLYWISHIWLTAHRGRMQADPVVFATNDRTSRILLLSIAATVALALIR